MPAEDKTLEVELDEAFDELSLINCTDLDVSLKIIMLSDEKTAQSIRGDINHLMLKYIAADPSLKDKLKKSDYMSFNDVCLREAYNKIRDAKIAHYDRAIQCEIDKELEDKSNIQRLAGNYGPAWAAGSFEARFPKNTKNTNYLESIFRLKIPGDQQITEIFINDRRIQIEGELPGSIIGFNIEYSCDYSDQNNLSHTCNHYVKIYYPPDYDLIKKVVEYHNTRYNTTKFTVEASLKAIQMRRASPKKY